MRVGGNRTVAAVVVAVLLVAAIAIALYYPRPVTQPSTSSTSTSLSSSSTGLQITVQPTATTLQIDQEFNFTLILTSVPAAFVLQNVTVVAVAGTNVRLLIGYSPSEQIQVCYSSSGNHTCVEGLSSAIYPDPKTPVSYYFTNLYVSSVGGGTPYVIVEVESTRSGSETIQFYVNGVPASASLETLSGAA